MFSVWGMEGGFRLFSFFRCTAGVPLPFHVFATDSVHAGGDSAALEKAFRAKVCTTGWDAAIPASYALKQYSDFA